VRYYLDSKDRENEPVEYTPVTQEVHIDGKRTNHDLRKIIDYYLSAGWKIVNRDPIVIQRYGKNKEVNRLGMLLDID